MISGGGDQWRMPAPQFSNSSRMSVITDPSAQKHLRENSADTVSSLDKQNGGMHQQPESVAAYAKACQKTQDDLHEVGLKIKHHEDNVKYLKTLKKSLDESILNMQVALGSYDKSCFTKTIEKDVAHLKSEEDTIESILKHENSAAALFCFVKKQAGDLSSDHSLMKDVPGIVATLGKVDDDNLSRLLSEYLGLDIMLAVVCKTNEGVKTLETYNKEGLIDKNYGLHSFAASIERPLVGRFTVICLEDIRPYAGGFIDGDPQRRLALPKPKLPNGETPSGFLGFAVNMITIDRPNLYCISNGHNLRETLFYHLFGNLQVYRSRTDMSLALSCINNAAISLDGGMIRSPGVFSLGHNQEDIDVKFPIGSEHLNLPERYFDVANEMKEMKWKKDRIMEDMKREQNLLDHAKSNYELKKVEIIQFLAGTGSHASQTQYQVGRVSTPR